MDKHRMSLDSFYETRLQDTIHPVESRLLRKSLSLIHPNQRNLLLNQYMLHIPLLRYHMFLHNFVSQHHSYSTILSSSSQSDCNFLLRSYLQLMPQVFRHMKQIFIYFMRRNTCGIYCNEIFPISITNSGIRHCPRIRIHEFWNSWISGNRQLFRVPEFHEFRNSS